jgi:hypothetical protein
MQTVWIVLAAGLMLAWLYLAVFGSPRAEAAGATVLCYGPFIRTLALLLALATPMIMIYVVWTFPWPNSSRMNLAGLSLFAFSIVGGLLLIDVTRMQVVVSEEGLARSSPWSGAVTLKWIEVERVRYSAVNRWFVVEGAGRTIRVSRHLAGIGAFVELLRRHVAAERLASAAAVLDAVK